MSEIHRVGRGLKVERRLVLLLAALGLGAAACRGGGQEGGRDTLPPVATTSAVTPKHNECKALPAIGKPTGRSKDDGPWLYEFPTAAACSVPIYDPNSLRTVDYLEPGDRFFVGCVADKPTRIEVTVTGPDKLGSSGDTNLSDQAMPQFVKGAYQPPHCPVPEPSAVVR